VEIWTRYPTQKELIYRKTWTERCKYSGSWSLSSHSHGSGLRSAREMDATQDCSSLHIPRNSHRDKDYL